MQTTAWPPLWRGAGPLILASTSESRRALFSAAGLEAESIAPKVDERGLEDGYLAGDGSLEDLPMKLAEAKALAVS
ncbi:MAG TPA: Maf family protein, partial [Roseiarcus sp.]